MKKLLGFALMGGMILNLSGCFSTEVSNSGDVNQDKVYQKYEVTVNEGSNNASVEAMFRFDSKFGNSLFLTDPSRITINNQQLMGDKKFLTGYVYEADIAIPEDKTYSFLYTNNAEKQFRNAITINPVALAEVPQEISKDSKIKLEIDGQKVLKGESIELQITVNDTSHVQINLDGKHFKLKPSHFANISPGPGSMKVVRHYSSKLSEGTSSGGKIEGKYVSNAREFQLVE